VSRRRAVTFEQSWADRLGIDSTDHLRDELQARFEHLSRFVLNGEMPPAGKSSAEAATAYGDLWVLAGFLADAQRLMNGQEARS
jgi:hypothetical protein